MKIKYNQLGKTPVKIPPIIFGTSCLGNLYQALSYEKKLEIMKEWFRAATMPVVIDSAGKYGAGLALEVIGTGLKELGVDAGDIVISNKLGWLRAPLKTPEPLFEPGVWMDLDHDAVQKISYHGIMECWQQGCELLGQDYFPQLVSVHDPDEYLARAASAKDRVRLFQDIVDAYGALDDLKKGGRSAVVGVGAKDWQVIRELKGEIDLDWVMLAVSFTVYHHPPEVLDFIDELNDKGVGIINSAIFHSGFLTGGRYFDYRIPDPNEKEDAPLFLWREKFLKLCARHHVSPAAACVQFGLSHPGVLSIALNTSKPERIEDNVAMVTRRIPGALWEELKEGGLIAGDYPYL